MKTTLVVSDRVLARLKREAHRRGTTISELVEAALRRFLEEKPRRKALPRLPEFDSGGARVDVANREALYQVMEE
jgi:hypothetical protein